MVVPMNTYKKDHPNVSKEFMSKFGFDNVFAHTHPESHALHI